METPPYGTVTKELGRAAIIHFATHGEFDLRDPLNGHGIWLTPASEDSGLLDALTVRQMNLSQARLVVLNICDGAVCRYRPGDEPLGLFAALIMAGAENLLGGLWELPD